VVEFIVWPITRRGFVGDGIPTDPSAFDSSHRARLVISSGGLDRDREPHRTGFGEGQCYTDGLSEAADARGQQIGEDLLDAARTLAVESPMAAGATLLGLVDAFRRGEPVRDDETLIVLKQA
jgi:Stage II sporulation protein E (SpoIIE)